MPMLPFTADDSLDPERADILNRAFTDVCADLGLGANTPYSRALIAKKVVELADGRRDPAEIRAAVVAFLSSPR